MDTTSATSSPVSAPLRSIACRPRRCSRWRRRIDIRFDPEVFGADGEVRDAMTREFLRSFMTGFRDHIARLLAVLPRD